MFVCGHVSALWCRGGCKPSGRETREWTLVLARPLSPTLSLSPPPSLSPYLCPSLTLPDSLFCFTFTLLSHNRNLVVVLKPVRPGDTVCQAVKCCVNTELRYTFSDFPEGNTMNPLFSGGRCQAEKKTCFLNVQHRHTATSPFTLTIKVQVVV